ncbi:Fasciclin-like arabinogalactan protein [Golovinomyces cichoracearum]|uniref:Fasciclin-like arabinogalactan protein n=1 Tax=Golovinomyces cichoracearum TaxID=62708 RepID=A0A420ILJ5_9PEZI|nr:Fasciclin-like arabinogalactan protein [Golovinomyces cichoracearum]
MILAALIHFGLCLTISAQSVTDVIAHNSDTSSLFQILSDQPEIKSTLKNAQNITILAPSNAAVQTFLDSDMGADAVAHPDFVANLLKYHVLVGTYRASDFGETPAFPRTLLTNSSYTSLKDGQVVKAQLSNSDVVVTSGLLSKSRVVTSDITASNGVVHIIDRFLTIPSSISETAVEAKLDSLVAALQKTDLVNTVDHLPNATVFAPNDAAFEASSDSTSKLNSDELKNVLTYHVAKKIKYSIELDHSHLHNLNGSHIHVHRDGKNITVDSAKVITADVLVSNGVVHVIDKVLGLEPVNHEAHNHKDPDSNGAGSPIINKHGLIALCALIMAQVFAL